MKSIKSTKAEYRITHVEGSFRVQMKGFDKWHFVGSPKPTLERAVNLIKDYIADDDCDEDVVEFDI